MEVSNPCDKTKTKKPERDETLVFEDASSPLFLTHCQIDIFRVLRQSVCGKFQIVCGFWTPTNPPLRMYVPGRDGRYPVCGQVSDKPAASPPPLQPPPPSPHWTRRSTGW